MKVFEVGSEIRGTGEYVLGARQTGSHACYLIYGSMDPGESGRELKPGDGHEEIFLAVKGDFRLTGDFNLDVKQGQAVHLRGKETCAVENLSDETALYVMAGGHSTADHGH